jgi:hypothetical protein
VLDLTDEFLIIKSTSSIIDPCCFILEVDDFNLGLIGIDEPAKALSNFFLAL